MSTESRIYIECLLSSDLSENLIINNRIAKYAKCLCPQTASTQKIIEFIRSASCTVALDSER